MHDYYNRQGQPVASWNEAFPSSDWDTNHRVALDEVNGYRISTVFLGLNHALRENTVPLIFETMVFRGDSNEDLYSTRYSSEDQARGGHQVTVDFYSGEMNP